MKSASVLGALCWALAACAGEASVGDARALHELEGLTFVRAGDCFLEGYMGEWSDCSIERALLVDRFELTRRDWAYYHPDADRQRARGAGWQLAMARTTEQQLDWPAYLTYPEAQELAALRGMRLLRAKEWIHVATGRRSHSFPWGTEKRTSVANTLELGLGTPCAVGTFEGGRSQPYGCYDMLGNVWEWVSDRIPGQNDLGLKAEADAAGLDDRLALVMGGGFNSRRRVTFGGEPPFPPFHARTVDQRTLSPEIGVRMCADVETYLSAQCRKWMGAPDARERVRAVGRRWAEVSGREFVLPTLEELAAQPGAGEGLSWLAEGARSNP